MGVLSNVPFPRQSPQTLADDGLVELGPEEIRATPRGRLLLRNIAMCFDRYLDQKSIIDARPRFSRAI